MVNVKKFVIVLLNVRKQIFNGIRIVVIKLKYLKIQLRPYTNTTEVNYKTINPVDKTREPFSAAREIEIGAFCIVQKS